MKPPRSLSMHGGLLRRVLWLFLNGSPQAPSYWNPRGIFSDTHCGNLVKLLEENLLRSWGPRAWALLEPRPHELQLLVSCGSVFPSGHRLPTQLPLVNLGSGELWLPVFTPLSVQSWGLWFALCPPLLWNQEELFIFQSAQLFDLLGHSDNLVFVHESAPLLSSFLGVFLYLYV